MRYCILLLTKPKEYKLSEPLSDIIQRRAVVDYVTGSSFEQCLYKMYDKLQGAPSKGVNSVCKGVVDDNDVFYPDLKNDQGRRYSSTTC